MKLVRKNEVAVRIRLLVLGGLVASVGAFAACGGDEDNDSNSGAQGSACSSNSECGDGLICIPTASQSLEQKDLQCYATCVSACGADVTCAQGCLEECDVTCADICQGDADCIASCESGEGGGSDIPWEDATPGMCTNTCDFADDGECDDGRPGSETDFCDPGTDCNDCGAVPGGGGGGGETPTTCADFCADFPAEQQAACLTACQGAGGGGSGGGNTPSTCQEFCGDFPAEVQAACIAECESDDGVISGGSDGGGGGGGGSTATGTCQPDPNAGGGGGTPDAGGGDDAGPTCDSSDVEGNACAEAEDCEVTCDCGVTSGQCDNGSCASAADACAAGCDFMGETFNGGWCR